MQKYLKFQDSRSVGVLETTATKYIKRMCDELHIIHAVEGVEKESMFSSVKSGEMYPKGFRFYRSKIEIGESLLAYFMASVAKLMLFY